MKKINSFRQLILIVIVLTCFGLNAQHNYTADDLSINFLKRTYENAFMNVTEVENTYIVVKEVFNIYVEIDSNKRYIVLSAAYPLRENATEAEILQLMNKLNSEIILAKFYYSKASHSIGYVYYFWTERGFNSASLLSATKLFSQAINLSLDKDTTMIIK